VRLKPPIVANIAYFSVSPEVTGTVLCQIQPNSSIQKYLKYK